MVSAQTNTQAQAKLEEKIMDIVKHPERHQHDHAGFMVCCTIQDQLKPALVGAHWQNVRWESIT